MALTAEVTKNTVTQLTGDDFTVSIHVEFKNESEEVILERDYSTRYYSAMSVNSIETYFQTEIAADWDKYVAEQGIFNAAAFDTLVSDLQTAANSYINT